MITVVKRETPTIKLSRLVLHKQLIHMGLANVKLENKFTKSGSIYLDF